MSGQAEAQRCYAEALRVDVRHAPAWRGMGDLMRERGEHQSAVACYQACTLAVADPGIVVILAEWSYLTLAWANDDTTRTYYLKHFMKKLLALEIS